MAQLRPQPLISLPVDKLSTGCPQLDYVLGGGLPCGSLTELAGEAAASKTQLCLQLLLSVQLPREFGGLDGSAVYVYTEGEPAMKRLHQLARFLPLRYPPEALASLPDPAANIYVEKGVETVAGLLGRLQRLRPLLERQRRLAAAGSKVGGSSGGSTAGASSSSSAARAVRLLVVDSVAHVCRDMGDKVGVGELTGRTEVLFKISALLRRYADEFCLAVLLVNQVVDCFAPETRGLAWAAAAAAAAPATARHAALTGGLRLTSLGREVVPALGLAWANCVNSRLFLERCAGPDGTSPALFHGAPSPAAQVAAAQGAAGGGNVAAPALRKLQVLFSPHLPQGECFYVVEATGVRGLHPSELEQHDAAAEAAAAAAWEQQRREQQRQAWEEQRQQQQQQAWELEQQQQGWQQQPEPQGQQPLHQGWQQPQHQEWQHQQQQHGQQVAQQGGQQQGQAQSTWQGQQQGAWQGQQAAWQPSKQHGHQQQRQQQRHEESWQPQPQPQPQGPGHRAAQAHGRGWQQRQAPQAHEHGQQAPQPQEQWHGQEQHHPQQQYPHQWQDSQQQRQQGGGQGPPNCGVQAPAAGSWQQQQQQHLRPQDQRRPLQQQQQDPQSSW